MAGATSPVPRACLLVFGLAWIGLAIDPVYPEDWLLENALTLVLAPIAVAVHRRRPFSNRACVQATLFAILHTIGSHYTYSEVPAGDWLRDAAGLSRNHYDRLVHFAFGLLMLRPLRELARLDDGGLGGRAVTWLALAQVMTASALYELVEWTVAAIVDPAAGTAYLGTQGDPWDAQKDMACALLGGVLALGVDYAQRRFSGLRTAPRCDSGRPATASRPAADRRGGASRSHERNGLAGLGMTPPPAPASTRRRRPGEWTAVC